MKIFKFTANWTLFTLVAILPLLAACGKNKKASTPTTPTTTSTNLCGPVHEMNGRKKVWEKSQCAQAANLWVDENSVDDKGVRLGTTNINHGRLTVKYHGLVNDTIQTKPDGSPWDNYGVFFKAKGWDVYDERTNTTYKGEANWWFMAAKYNENQIQTWLGSQRFDGVCGSPPHFCEHKDFHEWELQFFDEKDIVQFDCGWDYSLNQPDGLAWCDIKKTNTGQVYHYEVTMRGPYNLVTYIGVGNKAFDHNAYPSFQHPVSDFKVTIFE